MENLDRPFMRLKSRLILLIGLTAALACITPETVFAQNSLGVGSGETSLAPSGPFAGTLFWIQQKQQAFYRLLTAELGAMRTEGRHIWWLAGLSFAYGIFHAAGPGHGKAVISSYMIANEIAARRGIALAFASAFVQALSAVALISVAVFALRGTGFRHSELANTLEISSYAAVTMLGGWLLFRKLRPIAAANNQAQETHGGHPHDICHDHACSTVHAPDPAQLQGKFGLRHAWSAVLAVGLRPCSGALIVLTFAFLNGLYLAGIASAFAMAFGTGATVALLAAAAVWAKDLAVTAGGAVNQSARVFRAIEIAGAGMVLLVGALLLSASLY
jgi:nickel/cobalt transporter (NicO) family protein